MIETENYSNKTTNVEFAKYARVFVSMIALLAMISVLMVGCSNRGGDETVAIADEPEGNPVEEVAEDANPYDPVVATVNGIGINASAVYNELEWSIELMSWTYFEAHPDDDEIDLDKTFMDDLTFGEAVRREAARFAALGALFEDYAERNNIEVEEVWGMHPAFIVIQAIIDDAALFAEFEQYMDAPINDPTSQAEALLERAQAGEDFDYLITQYGEDPGMASNPDGYTFVAGVMVSEFEEATLALEIGGISGLVRSQFGYHIIKRVEPNLDNVMRPPGQEEADDDVVMAAKHILVMAEDMDEKMFDAVIYAFENKLENATIEFLPALDEIVVEP